MLSVKNLTKIHPHKPGQPGGGIRDASFHLDSGAFFTLLGPSVCGETTTLPCTAGLEHPDDGAAGKATFSNTLMCGQIA